MASNNIFAYYYLANDVDCTGIKFKPIGTSSLPFTGKFDGRNNKITNLTFAYPSTYSSLGLFDTISGATVININFLDVKIYSTSNQNVAVLAGRAVSISHVENITLDSTFQTGNFISGYSRVGSIISHLMGGSTMRNIVVRNTFIQSSGTSLTIGGVVGQVDSSYLIDCYNLGFEREFQNIIYSTAYGSFGGVVGICNYCFLIKCGTVNGSIIVSESSSYVGGVAGSVTNPNALDQLYSREGTVILSGYVAGGIFGQLSYSLIKTFSISNVYSTSHNITGFNTAGGIWGQLYLQNSELLQSDCYVSNKVFTIQTNNIGVIAGSITGSTGCLFKYDNFYYNNATNHGAPIYGSKSSNIIFNSTATPFQTNLAMYQAILNNFNQTVWCGNRLRSEYGFTCNLN